MAINKILERLDSLIVMGENVLKTLRRPSGGGGRGMMIEIGGSSYADSGVFTQWRTSCVAFLKTLPSEYVYQGEFEKSCNNSEELNIRRGMAILKAARDDIAGGYLQKVEALVSASIFSDFLEMAEYLLDNGYKDPAASLTGAVLENELRRMCRDNDITLKNEDNIGSMNQKLFQQPVYGKPQMRQISLWQAIRDSADHGKFDDYNIENVKNMLEGVKNFLASQLS